MKSAQTKRIIMSCDWDWLSAPQELLLNGNRMHYAIRPPTTSVIFCTRGTHSTTSGILQTSLWMSLLAFFGSSAQCCPHQPGTTKQETWFSFISTEFCNREMWAQKAGQGSVAWYENSSFCGQLEGTCIHACSFFMFNLTSSWLNPRALKMVVWGI